MPFVQLRLVGVVATVLILFYRPGPAPAAGPSFSCAQATAPVDRAICADDGLSALDVTLGRAFRAALAGDPAGRDESLRAQRAWLKGRADACHLPKQGEATTEQAACLTRITRERIANLQPRDPRDVILATKIAVEIRRRNGFIDQPGSLDEALGADPDSPVRFAADGEKLTEKLAARLPPFDGLNDMKEQGLVYRFANRSDMLAVAASEGTARCWSYTIFREVGTRYEAIADPSDGEHCGESIAFGSTRKVAGDPDLPLFADATYGKAGPTLLLLAFRSDRWRKVGRFALAFETALDVTERSCAAQASCADLASDALQLARARDAAGAEEPNHLGAAVRTTALPMADPESLPDFGGHDFEAWSTFESGAPVYKLATASGVVALRISHGTLGWRVDEDYVVAAYRFVGKTWQPVAGFRIEKKRVKLRSVTVE